MVQVNVGEAKTQLSRLLEQAASGVEVIIARSGTPIARLVPVTPPPGRTLGFLDLDLPDDFFDPLDGDDLDGWE